jgi:hypothetical protein
VRSSIAHHAQPETILAGVLQIARLATDGLSSREIGQPGAIVNLIDEAAVSLT